MIKVCVITGYGINADWELKKAFELAGSAGRLIHINDIINQPDLLKNYEILAFAGGFSFGDHIGSGKVFGNLFKKRLKDDLDNFVEQGKLVIGICNGFQVLVKMGILPNMEGDWSQEVSLIHNDSGKFEDRWVKVEFLKESPCFWTKGLDEMEVPVRHGEGKFVFLNNEVEKKIIEQGLDVVKYKSKSGNKPSCENKAGYEDNLCYPHNPNGSERNIAGICDRTGRVFGLMPHPEAFIFPQNNPRWSREKISEAYGLEIFKNGVRYFSG